MSKPKKMFMEKILPTINRHELPKFLYTATLIFLIAYIHNILRLSKDPLVMTYLGSEAFSAIKIWTVLPALMGFMFLYIKLSDVFTRSQLFHIISWLLLSYFVLFAFVIYPNRDLLSISINESLVLKLPILKYLFIIIKNWPYCVFYIFSELWVTIMLSISFWQIANHITSLEESKRFYFLFGFAAQVGSLVASLQSKFVTISGKDWQLTINYIAISITIAGVLLSISLNQLKNIVGPQSFNLKINKLKIKNQKPGMISNLKYIASSKPILLITSLLFCYTASANLAEGVWKKSVETLFNKDLNPMQHFMSDIGIYTAIISLVCATGGIYLSRVCKWKTITLITPIVSTITGIVFFILTLLMLPGINSLNIISMSAWPILNIAAYFGAINHILSRSTKHTLFDSTKEMIYIPLNDNLKTKGKSAAESVGIGFGKGFSAFIEQALLALFPSLTLITISPVLAIIFIAISIWWIYSVVILDRWLNKVTNS